MPQALSILRITHGYFKYFQLFTRGFVNQAGIIIFIIIIGGCFWIINKTQAIDAGIQLLLTKFKKANNNSFFKIIETESLVLISVMLIFSLFGAIFGMSEETIAFIVIFVPLAISMGYDSIVGVAINLPCRTCWFCYSYFKSIYHWYCTGHFTTSAFFRLRISILLLDNH